MVIPTRKWCPKLTNFIPITLMDMGIFLCTCYFVTKLAVVIYYN